MGQCNRCKKEEAITKVTVKSYKTENNEFVLDPDGNRLTEEVTAVVCGKCEEFYTNYKDRSGNGLKNIGFNFEFTKETL